MIESITFVLTRFGGYDIHHLMMTNVIDTKQGTDAVGARELRNIAEKWVSELLSSGESVDLRRESRRVFEDACLDEVLWESFIDEWIDVVYEAVGERLAYCDFHSLTDWCKCGHSHDDHRLDCQHSTCDCERFQRARGHKRPKVRVCTRWALEQKAHRRPMMGELEARELRGLFGDLTGGV